MVAEAIKKIIEWRKKETLLNLFLKQYLRGRLMSRVEYFDTPLGEKVIIYCARPRLVLGRANERMEELVSILKQKFGFKNPQIEAVAVDNPFLDASIVAEMVAIRLERLGTRAAKNVGLRMVQQVMEAGARGVEIRLSGKLVGERATSIRFYAGYMKKSGEVNKEYVRKAIDIAKLPQGVVGIQVRILPPDVKLPDEVKIKEEIKIEEVKDLDTETLEKLRKILSSQT